MAEQTHIDSGEPGGFGERLKRAREHLGLKQKDFAARIGRAAAFLSEIENGKSKPGFAVLRDMVETFNLNLNYLVLGEGEMFREVSGEGEWGEVLAAVDDRKFREMIYYFHRAPVVKYAVYEFLSNYIFHNRDMIESEMERHEAEASETG